MNQVTCCDSIERREVVNLERNRRRRKILGFRRPSVRRMGSAVERIRTGDATAMQELYQVFGRGVAALSVSPAGHAGRR